MKRSYDSIDAGAVLNNARDSATAGDRFPQIVS